MLPLTSNATTISTGARRYTGSSHALTVMGGDAKKILSKSQIGHKNLESHISINKCVFGIFHDTIVLRFFLAFQ